jgi:hypothetical protein
MGNDLTQSLPATQILILKRRGFVVAALQGLVLPYLLLSFMFYGLVQLQHILLGHVVILHQYIRTIGLVVTLVVTFLYLLRIHRLRIEYPFLSLLTLCYCTYLVVDFAVKLASGRLVPAALVYAVTYLYFYVFLLLVLLIVTTQPAPGERVVNERFAFRALYLLAFPVFCLGYLQWFLNDPLVMVADESGYAVEVYIKTELQHVRAFSVFGSGFAYGHFITFIAALSLGIIVDSSLRRRWPFALLVASTLAIATTLTRNAYVEFVLAVGGILFIRWAISRGWSNRRIIGSALAACGAGYTGILAFFWLAPVFARGILDVHTFGLRLLGTASVVDRFFLNAQDAVSLLFGVGYIQGPKFAELQGIKPLMFDNTYVDVGLFSGLAGVLFHLVFFVTLFSFVLDRYRQGRGYWWLALSGMYFGYPLVSALNIYVAILYLLTCLVIAYDALSQRRLVRLLPEETMR